MINENPSSIDRNPHLTLHVSASEPLEGEDQGKVRLNLTFEVEGFDAQDCGSFLVDEDLPPEERRGEAYGYALMEIPDKLSEIIYSCNEDFTGNRVYLAKGVIKIRYQED